MRVSLTNGSLEVHVNKVWKAKKGKSLYDIGIHAKIPFQQHPFHFADIEMKPFHGAFVATNGLYMPSQDGMFHVRVDSDDPRDADTVREILEHKPGFRVVRLIRIETASP